MFGFRQKKNEDLEKFEFRDEPPENTDLPENRESKWDETLPAFDVDTVLGTKATEEDVQDVKPEETKDLETIKIQSTMEGAEKSDLEELSKKIEDENRTTNRKFKLITKNVNQLTLESQELIDLIKMYANTNGKFNEFIEEMHRLEERGWKFDQNIAALYKFRVGRALANMKKQSMSVEKICRKVGFTPSNIKVILNSPIEDLVSSLAGKTIEIGKPKR